MSTEPQQPTPVDFHSPQLTWKSITTGMALGGALSICNLYTGLKIGWGLNMSITGILLAFAFWHVVSRATKQRISMMGQLENNVNQSAVSAGGAVTSAGLVSAIPALTILDGVTLSWWQLSLWISTVCFVGIAVAMGLRKQMIVRDQLPFPGGLSCAQTLKEIYSTGSEAMLRVAMLGSAAVVGGLVKVAEILKWTKRTDMGLTVNGSPASVYSVALDPTLLMVAVGGLVGLKTCVSLMLGAVGGWIVLGSWIVDTGRSPEQRGPIGEWILWPGVTLMVVASLVSFSFSIPSILRAFRSTGGGGGSGHGYGRGFAALVLCFACCRAGAGGSAAVVVLRDLVVGGGRGGRPELCARGGRLPRERRDERHPGGRHGQGDAARLRGDHAQERGGEPDERERDGGRGVAVRGPHARPQVRVHPGGRRA